MIDRMDLRDEIRDFLTSRRARITPAEVGLPDFGTRRVPGLRRQEVATLAGLSVDYYNRLERGGLGSASEGVLDALAGALRLDDAERAHLYDLARASQPAARSRSARRAAHPVRANVQRLLDAITAPAYAENARLDALAANDMARALYPVVFAPSPQANNWARFTFLDPRSREFYVDWNRAARECVALLRTEVGKSPHDRSLSDLIGELATRSDEFRTLWAAHHVRLHTQGSKRLNHPIVGELELSYDRLELTAEPGLMIAVFSAEPGSPSAQALDLLASWAATPHAADASDAAPNG
jgi:transcriptional regulator with XRE-family HTH domain